MNDRREKGSGSIYVKDGKVIARCRWTDESGKGREKTFVCGEDTPANWKVATRKLKGFRESLIKGEVVEKDMKVGALFDKVIAEVYEESLRQSTLRLYRMFRKHHIKPIESVKLSELTGTVGIAVLERTIKQAKPQRGEKLSAQTKNLLRRFIIGTLNHAVRLGYLKDNPAAKTLAVTSTKRRVKALTPETVKEILDNTPSPVFKGIFASQVMLGLRIGEACGMKDENLDGEWYEVSSQVQRVVRNGKSKLEDLDLKTETAHRVLQVPPQLAELLASVPRTGPYVFATVSGKPIEPRLAQRALDATVKRINKKGRLKTLIQWRTSPPISYATRGQLSRSG